MMELCARPSAVAAAEQGGAAAPVPKALGWADIQQGAQLQG
jgi:hypothetical protein